MKITIKEGVTMELTAPQTYEVNYLDGTSTYNEPFVIINFTKAAADQELKGFRSIIDGLMAFFATTAVGGAAHTLGVSVAAGSILALITKIAGPLIEQKFYQLNVDGSLTQYMAYHYWGNSSEGIDPTAWPIPGVNPDEWFAKVNQSITSFKKANVVKKTTESISSGIEMTKEKAIYDFEIDNTEDFSKFSTNSFNISPVNLLGANKSELIFTATDATFSESFKSCMSLLGLETPSSLFNSATSAVGTINAIYAVVLKYGKKVTIAELIGAGILEDAMIVAGGCTAAFYLGACIGCGIHAGIGSLIPSL